MHPINTKPLTAKEARVCVTGWDFNRPAPFPGLGVTSLAGLGHWNECPTAICCLVIPPVTGMPRLRRRDCLRRKLVSAMPLTVGLWILLRQQVGAQWQSIPLMTVVLGANLSA